ncbi:hypothetical protein BGW36DRAFT_176554 [Talaromyces proteolyticus]|uniref:Uncharacterized protein n=1 Tax=Talaromyces proteolyticus TaxID=1131652 RepID=A0AAD4Q124_9EURO|nr:uncharacterized protein BGW36DRAFT_176554 [Talaromyces proteolyticus]KAH8697876.1 hypothetical protein BGW36DRAFT_176554 [Talaromyces proteolyticus]
MSLPTNIGLWLVGVALNVVAVRAELPLTDNPSAQATATLKDDRSVTFDPLGVAAVLHNPRASASAARLYTQYDRKVFIWPHTMMMGATLIPVKVLVEHLTATFQSIHPAITLCTQDTESLPVVSNMVFKEFPLDFSKMWLNDVIAYKSSSVPVNDFMLVCMDELETPAGLPKATKWLGRRALDFISLWSGLIIAAGIVLGILYIDIWAITLFFFYGMHWLAGLAISTTSLVTPQDTPIKEDDTTRYAIYQRAAGGTVVFKGRQDTMEAWARTTWRFKRTWTSNTLHWFWTLTGTLSAICSVACMVNMRGFMQLVFLAELIYSSLAEIVATRVSRILQGRANASDRAYLVSGNKFRTKGVIRATIEVDPQFRLEGLDWVGMKRMPSDQIFQDMQDMLKSINRFQKRVETGGNNELEFVSQQQGPRWHPDVDAAFEEFKTKGTRSEDPDLVVRIQNEAEAALQAWWDKRQTKRTMSSGEKDAKASV